MTQDTSTTKKWYQSNTVRAALALIIAAIAYLAVSFNLVDQSQMEAATGTFPEVKNGLDMIFAGQIFAGIGAIAGALVVYFRITAKKLIG